MFVTLSIAHLIRIDNFLFYNVISEQRGIVQLVLHVLSYVLLYCGLITEVCVCVRACVCVWVMGLAEIWGLFHKTSLPKKPGLFQLV